MLLLVKYRQSDQASFGRSECKWVKASGKVPSAFDWDK